MFKNNLLRKTALQEATEWKKFHNHEFRNLYFSNITEEIKPREMQEKGQRHAWGYEKCMHNFSQKTSLEETT
jgi:hypothetical protein